MFNYSRFLAVGIIALTGGCASSNGVDTGTGAAANNGSVGGSGAANGTNGGAGNGTNNGGAANGTNGGSGNGTAGGDGNVGGAGAATGSTGGGSAVCGSVLCTATSCGSLVDPCGAVVDCGYTNCAQGICGAADPNTGVATPNVCPPCTKLDCTTAGANCGSILDGCGGTIDCGTCTAPACCGCAPTGQVGTPNVCGSGGTGGSGLDKVCIAGTQGCLCDSMGTCAPGLTCNTAATPTVCCNGTDCTLPTTTTDVATCTGTGVAQCTPGITIPTATGTTDNCGYPTTSFKENAFICGIVATGGGAAPAKIEGFFNDEWPLTLGCTTTANPVAALPSDPGTVSYPGLGDPTCNDSVGRPMRPALFITDITADPTCKAGDQQAGGKAYDAIGISGTWTYANATGTPVKPNQTTTPYNLWNLGTAADPLPASVSAQCPCTGTPGTAACPGTGYTSKGYGAEAVYEAALVSGHSYRLQIMGHDGDQTQGGDSGEACVTFCAGNGVCPKRTCAANYPGKCGPQSDGCSGTLDCGTCCTPRTCQQACALTAIKDCSPTYDAVKYAVDCPQSDGCNGTIDCYCPIG